MAHSGVKPGRNTMNRSTLILLLAGCVGASAVRAQSPSNPAVVQPTSPAPVVVSTVAPQEPAPAVMPAPAAHAANTAPTNITQIVHTPQLPSAAEITNAAAAQGLTVERIVQTSNQVIAFYRHASGETSNVAYQSLPPAGTSTNPAAPNVVVTSPPNVVVASPPPTVVYQQAPRVVYYDYPSYYYPRVWYPPVSFSFGLGYHRGYHGGYHGGYGGRHHHRHR